MTVRCYLFFCIKLHQGVLACNLVLSGRIINLSATREVRLMIWSAGAFVFVVERHVEAGVWQKFLYDVFKFQQFFIWDNSNSLPFKQCDEPAPHCLGGRASKCIGRMIISGKNAAGSTKTLVRTITRNRSYNHMGIKSLVNKCMPISEISRYGPPLTKIRKGSFLPSVLIALCVSFPSDSCHFLTLTPKVLG